MKMQKILAGISTVILCLSAFTGLTATAQDYQNYLTKGVDISKHQGTIDFEKAQSTGRVNFAILRCGITLTSKKMVRDSYFLNYVENCKKEGIPIGVYYFSDARNPEEARAEAKYVLNLIDGIELDYPVYFDWEIEKLVDTIKLEDYEQICDAFCSTIQESGYYAGVYMGAYDAKDLIAKTSISDKYSLWIAHTGYSNIFTTGTNFYRKNYDMVQYAQGKGPNSKYKEKDTFKEGLIDGIATDIDLVATYKNFPYVIRSKGFNGFVATDLNGDGETDVSDARLVLNAMIQGTYNTKYDINQDGVVDADDAVAILKTAALK